VIHRRRHLNRCLLRRLRLLVRPIRHLRTGRLLPLSDTSARLLTHRRNGRLGTIMERLLPPLMPPIH
jgi:hypothetical protein